MVVNKEGNMAKQESEEPKKEEKKDEVELTEVVTQTAPAIKLPDGNVVSMEQFFVWLGNQVYEINKNTG